MSEFNPEESRSTASQETGLSGSVSPAPSELGELDAMDRFALALAISLVLHFALILGVQIKAAQQPGKTPSAVEVRIAPPAVEVSNVELAAAEPAVAEVRNESETAEPVRDQEEAPPQSQPAAPVVEQVSSLLPTLEVPLLEDPTWYPAKQVDVHPTALHPIRPVYPEKGVELGVDGKVVLLLMIDETGAVKEVAVVGTYPEGVFEESALAAFRDARFTPALKEGRAVKSQVMIRVNYELNGRKSPAAAQPPLPP